MLSVTHNPSYMFHPPERGMEIQCLEYTVWGIALRDLSDQRTNPWLCVGPMDLKSKAVSLMGFDVIFRSTFGSKYSYKTCGYIDVNQDKVVALAASRSATLKKYVRGHNESPPLSTKSNRPVILEYTLIPDEQSPL